MKEAKANLWTYNPVSPPLIVRCITTNGTVKSDGRCVMGRGVAYQATKLMPTLAIAIGTHIQRYGNTVWGPVKIGSIVRGKVDTYQILTFPIKHNWWDDADLQLIRKSATKLIEITNKRKELVFLLPRPGCGNGHLDWEVVKFWIKGLPDNVVIVNNDENR